MLFYLIYFPVLLIGLGIYFVLDNVESANSKFSEKLTSSKDKELLNKVAKNAKKVKRILYLAYLLSLPFFIFFINNIKNLIIFVLSVSIFTLIPPLRNSIENLAVKSILSRKSILRFFLGKQ